MSPRSMNTTGPTLGAPEFVNDFLDREHLLPGGVKVDASQFQSSDAVVVDVGAAGAAAGATTVPVSPALTGPIPAGTIIWFSGAKFIRLSAAAAAGANSLTVTATPTALVDADVGYYSPSGTTSIPAGTAIGRTIAERDAGTSFGPAAAADDEIYLTAFDVTDAQQIDDAEVLRNGTVIKENYLPAFSTLAAGVQTALRTRYQMTVGND